MFIVFFQITCRVKTAITSNAPVNAPLTALQFLGRASYSASLCLASGTLTGTLFAIDVQGCTNAASAWMRKSGHLRFLG